MPGIKTPSEASTEAPMGRPHWPDRLDLANAFSCEEERFIDKISNLMIILKNLGFFYKVCYTG